MELHLHVTDLKQRNILFAFLYKPEIHMVQANLELASSEDGLEHRVLLPLPEVIGVCSAPGILFFKGENAGCICLFGVLCNSSYTHIR